jgi:hypothetical protein
MGYICACCFAAGESDTCAACQKSSCADCNGQKLLLKVEEEPEAKDLEDYETFLQRFEETLLPAYREHFENDVRKRWRTRCEVVRATIFATAMLEYRRKECSEDGISPADVRYAVALRSFGKLKKEPKGPRVLHLDVQESSDAIVPIGRGSWARRSATCAFSYLKLIKAPEDRARKIADIILGKDGGTAEEIVHDAFVLERLRKLGDTTHDSAEQFLNEANTLLKGEFEFLADLQEVAGHADARKAMICEAGLLNHLTKWDQDPDWRKIGRGALARVERVIDDYNDTLPFLTEFYFEDPTHKYETH